MTLKSASLSIDNNQIGRLIKSCFENVLSQKIWQERFLEKEIKIKQLDFDLGEIPIDTFYKGFKEGLEQSIYKMMRKIMKGYLTKKESISDEKQEVKFSFKEDSKLLPELKVELRNHHLESKIT